MGRARGGGVNAPGTETPPLEITTSRQFTAWLAEQRLSLAFTTYQSGKLFLVGLQPSGRLSVFERTFNRAMGLWANPATRLVRLPTRKLGPRVVQVLVRRGPEAMVQWLARSCMRRRPLTVTREKSPSCLGPTVAKLVRCTR